MIVANTRDQLHDLLNKPRNHQTVGFVPTMGALHDGHVSLIKAARKQNERVIASIFVNPKQFNDPADLHRYPRTPEADIELLTDCGCDILFHPVESEIYDGSEYQVPDLGFMETIMEGVHRPGHFKGMAEVVGRLCELIRPTRAYFGEKDFQQLAIIRFLASTKGYGTQIIGCPTIRESDGLAMSSRNILLTKEERSQAPVIYEALLQARKLFMDGNESEILKKYVQKVEQSGCFKVEYLYIGFADTLKEAELFDPKRSYRIFTAVRTPGIRLIDNIPVGH